MRIRFLLAGAVLACGAMVAGAVAYPAPLDRPEAIAPPENAGQWAQRGHALLQAARDEAAPTNLPQAQRAFSTSLRLQPQNNVAAFVGMAALANYRHDFSTSVRWSRQAIAANPYGASAQGLLGDALFELGKERAAAAAYQRMIELRPDTASYLRAAYTQQHAGATGVAIRTMRQALQAAGPAGELAAFVRHQLGDLYQSQGRYSAAERSNGIGTRIAPGFVPPQVGIAESYLARGWLHRALPLLEHAAQELPTLEYLSKLGDVYTAVGKLAEANRAYQRAADVLTELRSNGVQPDADFIVFYADHGLRLSAALREAFAIYENRPTPKVADALAWMLHAVGRDRQARTFAREAIRAAGASGSEYLHASQIERALGMHRSSARLLRRALALDPTIAALDPSQAQQK